MNILAVDTTTFAGSIALLDKTKLIAEVNVNSSLTYSERLLPAVDFLLQTNGLKVQDMDGFAVAAGPGSFTGIRIGLSTVKSFSYASGKPVAPVSTLKALALKLRHPQGHLLCPVLDAKKGEIFAALFESKGGKLKESIAQDSYLPDRFFSLLPSHRIIFFIGNGVDVYRDKIFQYFKDKARFSRRSPFVAYEVGLLGYEMLKRKKGKSAQELEPLYLRKSQAEEKN
ncbi:MAG: tRNA (adenosine(37)-N6)-threonylcarbamoyltransferase complex dimerization subunit type 1 TsaB [Candidatus Aminicenantes bacterium]|nr:tRNA (adenosine(37)-N6)-threonylcarbamoyltransferase complex dimerization subunit type 1 TsaB [Candidatus Aminicenantes bacterium]MBL7083974.1 tRNA (adenosine(37)-N6)-threonylcarbamoyltransferase complex dimerization subunit type 1 TsaB [Candidatus Aminicenantes bacterium]